MRLSHFLGCGLALVLAAYAHAQYPVPGTNPVHPRPPMPPAPGGTPAQPRPPQPQAPGGTPAQPLSLPGVGPNSARQPTALTNAPGAQAALRPFAPRSYYYPPALYRFGEISRSLGLVGPQIGQLNQFTEELRNRYRDAYDQFGSLTQAEQLVSRELLDQKYTSDWMNGASTILGTDRFIRYQQLELQRSGINALADPALQNWLNLTQKQRSDLSPTLVRSLQQREEIRRLAATDPNRTRQLYRDYRRQSEDLLNRFLTPEQQTTWRKVTGEPQDVELAFTTPEP